MTEPIKDECDHDIERKTLTWVCSKCKKAFTTMEMARFNSERRKRRWDSMIEHSEGRGRALSDSLLEGLTA